jgi:hypothetical protein
MTDMFPSAPAFEPDTVRSMISIETYECWKAREEEYAHWARCLTLAIQLLLALEIIVVRLVWWGLPTAYPGLLFVLACLGPVLGGYWLARACPVQPGLGLPFLRGGRS